MSAFRSGAKQQQTDHLPKKEHVLSSKVANLAYFGNIHNCVCLEIDPLVSTSIRYLIVETVHFEPKDNYGCMWLCCF